MRANAVVKSCDAIVVGIMVYFVTPSPASEEKFLRDICVGSALESAARILNMVPTKNFNWMPYEVSYDAKFFENSLPLQEANGSHGMLEASGSEAGLELIQEDDTQPSEKY
nr:hypothetical protein [Tanacetum cinerariifolium]